MFAIIISSQGKSSFIGNAYYVCKKEKGEERMKGKMTLKCLQIMAEEISICFQTKQLPCIVDSLRNA